VKLETFKFKRIVVVCADCEDRSDGPRHLGSKSATKELRRLSADSPVRARVTRGRCLGLCPHKALAAVAVGESLAAMSAEMEDEDDLRVLARYAFGPDGAKR
jgi:predicted metal-binding protein